LTLYKPFLPIRETSIKALHRKIAVILVLMRKITLALLLSTATCFHARAGGSDLMEQALFCSGLTVEIYAVNSAEPAADLRKESFDIARDKKPEPHASLLGFSWI
jgi:hypothetical protein